MLRRCFGDMTNNISLFLAIVKQQLHSRSHEILSSRKPTGSNCKIRGLYAIIINIKKQQINKCGWYNSAHAHDTTAVAGTQVNLSSLML